MRWTRVAKTPITQKAAGKGVNWREFRPDRRLDFEDLPEYVRSGFIQEGVAKAMRSKAPNKAFLTWLWQVAAPLYYPGKDRPLYLQEGRPFPRNPQFRPRAPLSEAHKQKIYQQFLANLEKVQEEDLVVNALVDAHKLPADKIRAVIRLQELESRWAADKIPLQTELSAGMEKALGSASLSEEDQKYPVDSRTVFEPGRPRFTYVDVETLPLIEKAIANGVERTGASGPLHARHPVLRKPHELPDGDTYISPSSGPRHSQMIVVKTDNTTKGKLWKETYQKAQREEANKRAKEERGPAPEYWLV